MRRAVALFFLFLLPACDGPTETSEPGGSAYDESRDGVLFVSNRYGIYSVYDLFRVNVDGTGTENVTQAPAGFYGNMTLSPDGSRIAVESDRVGCYNIWVMDVDGTDPVQLTGVEPGERCNETPFWSPDGSRIAFMSSRELSQGWQVYVMNADGSDPRKASIVPDADVVHGAYPLGWTPEGRVVFELFTDSGSTIYTVAPDGSGAEPLFDGAGGRDPVWSADGERMAFIRVSDGTYSLMVRDGARLEETIVTSGPNTLMDLPPATRGPWSPDGQRIAFYMGQGGRQIHVVNADGTGLRQLTDDAGYHTDFNGWSPDGTRIAFTSDRTGTDDVYLIDADGTGLVNLTDSPAEDGDALWLPAR